MKYKLTLVYQGVVLARAELECEGTLNYDGLKCKAFEIKEAK